MAEKQLSRFFERGGAVQGNPPGLIIAKPNAGILYAALAKGSRLSCDDRVNSTRLFMSELNRFYTSPNAAVTRDNSSNKHPDFVKRTAKPLPVSAK